MRWLSTKNEELMLPSHLHPTQVGFVLIIQQLPHVQQMLLDNVELCVVHILVKQVGLLYGAASDIIVI